MTSDIANSNVSAAFAQALLRECQLACGIPNALTTLVYEGEIWLELDDAKTVHLKRGDVVVQNGTRRAWRNKGTKPVTMLFFLNGAKE
jgi:hypothetical protein